MTCQRNVGNSGLSDACPWVMDSFQTLSTGEDSMEVECYNSTMCDSVNGEYTFMLDIQVPVQGGANRMPSFDSTLTKVMRMSKFHTSTTSMIR